MARPRRSQCVVVLSLLSEVIVLSFPPPKKSQTNCLPEQAWEGTGL